MCIPSGKTFAYEVKVTCQGKVKYQVTFFPGKKNGALIKNVRSLTMEEALKMVNTLSTRALNHFPILAN